MEFTYRTKGTCSQLITLEIENGRVYNVKFKGGCPGNLQAIPRLVEGQLCEDVIERLSGITCGYRPTSCGDQLAKAISLAQRAEAASH